jgi:hypothetical protein
VCFSATASFVAAAGLGVVGVVSIARTTRRAQLPFASIPLLFAAQQATEGLVWRVVERADWWKSDTRLGTAFLFFALFVWPAWVPLSTCAMERSPRRRRVLAALAIVGALIGAYLFACAALRPSYACLAQQHLYYGVRFDPAPKHPLIAAYVAVTIAPLFVSSARGTSVFGAAMLAAVVVSGALFAIGFASVWCFFAAMLSVLVLAIVQLDRAPA